MIPDPMAVAMRLDASRIVARVLLVKAMVASGQILQRQWDAKVVTAETHFL